MGIRNIIAVVGLGLIAINVQAAPTTNSWKAGGSGFWDTDSAWSLTSAPSIADGADFITNAAAKTVTIDSVVVSDSPTTLTISNLTVGGSTTTNTLFLNMSGIGVPLAVNNSMLISNSGVLQITNSYLQVNGGAGGMFTVLGSLRVFSGAKVQVNKAQISNGATLQFGLGTNNLPVAVATDLTLGGTLNILNGGGFTNTTYTLFTYGGVLNFGGLTLGTTPTNSICVISTNTAGQVNLVVTFPPPPPTGPFQTVSVVRSGSDITVGWTAATAGTNAVQAENGDYNTNNFLDISSSIFVTPGITNTYVDVGGATNLPSRFYRVRIVP